MDDFLWLDQIRFDDRLAVGEKAFYLSHLIHRGYPIVPGFVVKAPVLRQFLASIEWLDPFFADLANSALHLDVDNPRQLQLVAQHIRREIIATALPEAWLDELVGICGNLSAKALIFRPSFALPSQISDYSSVNLLGLWESHVCDVSASAIASGAAHSAIANALKRTWAELFRARSLLYWQRLGVQLHKIHFAILVQPLQNSLASGWLQTGGLISPTTASRQASIYEIQATWGLEMPLVKGEILPDFYQVQPENNDILNQKLGVKTLAYRLQESAPASVAQRWNQVIVNPPLEVYLPSEEAQKQYVLSASYLSDLVQLGSQLTAELGVALSVGWILVANESEVLQPQFYITQIQTCEQRNEERELKMESRVEQRESSPSPDLPISRSSAIPVSTQVFKGLGAAGGKAIAKAQVVTNFTQNWENIPAGEILILRHLHPDWLPLLRKAAGVVAEQGGMTCHAAIIARELGIPAVVGVSHATKMIQTGDFLLVDGDRGEILLDSEQGLKLKKPKNRSRASIVELGDRERLQRLNSPSLMATQLMVNLSQPSTIERAANLPVDGVGLLRSELMLLEVLEGQHPNRWLNSGHREQLVEKLTEAVCEFASAFAPRPVFYRSLDWRSHEFQNMFPQSTKEANPMLGMRGTFAYLQDQTFFDLELEVLQEVFQSGYTNVNLILPFVRTVEEFAFCRHRISEFGLFAYTQFQLWMMAEVPSVLFLLPDYVKAGCRGISIGTNDLTQLLLGVDRDRAEMSAAFDERHPAVMQAIRQLIEMAKQLGIPCSICGQAPGQYPELIEHLVRWGISSISVSLDAVEFTHNAIVRAEQRLILEAARQQLGK
ncbi:putative PEP-binding protein [Aerosakkonemataceae cyanobacterium BLCC-F154]|uniref:Phosphoenolpyruvate synthase n=1 Tax=Floridaenema fluviatile BLCC-F154 TaxID=3153640 RepID=A0ABV4YGN5_9CYAN